MTIEREQLHSFAHRRCQGTDGFSVKELSEVAAAMDRELKTMLSSGVNDPTAMQQAAENCIRRMYQTRGAKVGQGLHLASKHCLNDVVGYGSGGRRCCTLPSIFADPSSSCTEAKAALFQNILLPLRHPSTCQRLGVCW